jgi:universal stress protein A
VKGRTLCKNCGRQAAKKKPGTSARALQLVRHFQLIERIQAMNEVKTILCPTDFSENSELAFQMACRLARDYQARLVIVHVTPPPTVIYGDQVVLPPPPRDLEPLREKLRRVKPADTSIPTEHILAEGAEASEILNSADNVHADLIVMGTHGRTGLARLLLGSVAEAVLRKARCPVMTIKCQIKSAA